MLPEVLGELLRECRKNVGLSQRELAKACQTKKGTISKLEKGKIKRPPLCLILFYLRATGTPFGKFFTKLEELEFKEILPSEIEQKDYPKKVQKKVIRYALGIKYEKRGIISFPESGKKKIESLLWRIKPEGRKDYLSFAREYFLGLKRGEDLLPITSKYKDLGLDQSLMGKIKKIIGQVFKRELRRAEKRMLEDEKKRKMVEGFAKYSECQERFWARVKKLIFSEKGMTTSHLKVYLQVANWAYKILKKAFKREKEKFPFQALFKEREVSFREFGFPEIDDWREKMIERENLDRDILNEIIKIVSEEYYKAFLVNHQSKNPTPAINSPNS